jgi:hypothetical protein
MNGMNIGIAKVSDSQHGLASAKVQLGLLNRLLQENPSLLGTDGVEQAEIENELESVSSLTHLITQKIDLIYRRLSLKFQLPIA